ncbi:MAG: peptide chain release factor N(5)-glutamine methyltransferase, partial [Actinobacteria bacterium]|nr:peptide chain release factor N(5)-glutamine methyltransferase [Actinomycetota bacterium]
MSGAERNGRTVRWRVFLREATEGLRAAGVACPEVSARRIVEHASGCEGADYVLALDQPATVRGVAAFDRMLARRLLGEPLQYVLGRWGFRTLDLMVDARVLIPRPETEELVDHALAELDRLHGEIAGRHLVAADLGTGSGAIALSIAVERDWVDVWATDVSPDALAVASANLAGIGRPASRVRVAEGDWLDALPRELRGCLDLIVSNPPYIAACEALPAEVVDWEPAAALVAGPTGLEAYRRILRAAGDWLHPAGAIVLEIAPHQATEVGARGGRPGFAVASH